MKKLLLSGTLLVCLSIASIAVRVSSAPKQPSPKASVTEAKFQAHSRAIHQARARAMNSPHTKWIAKSLMEMQTIKVGMTRAQLLKVFTTEGGVSSRQWRRYVYRECPYIKVDVQFRPVGKSNYPHAQSRNDVITKISQPFLEWSHSN